MVLTSIPVAGEVLTGDTFLALLTERTPVSAVKISDETVNNSATLQDDDELFISLAASARYAVRFWLLYNSGTTPDIKFGLTVPASTTGTWGGIGYDTASALLTFGPLSITVVLPFGGIAADKLAYIEALVTTSTTAGTMTLQWAQNTANASDTKVKAGSYIIATRIS